VVLYSPICKKWALNSTDVGRTEKGDIKSLRGDAGHTLRDEISNGTIRNKLQIFNIVGKIAELKNKRKKRLIGMQPQRETRKPRTQQPY
jgi:hypothetical protein